MEHDRFFEALVREKTLGAHDHAPDLTFGEATPERRLVGFVAGVRGTRGGTPFAFVRLLTVHPAWRNRGVGAKLLNEFETRARQGGARKVSIMDVPTNYFMPGVDPRYTEATCFLEKHGYARGATNQNLVCDLGPGRFDCAGRIEALGREGIAIRRATPEDRPTLEIFLGRDFPGWEYEVFNALENDPSIVHIALQAGEVIAFAASEGNNKGTGWFGPMGTTPAARGKGIGALTLQLCLNDLADLGFRRAVIPWVGPVRFYARFCGARRERVFWTYEKEF